ncbi:MAG: transaldolase family protein, partial [Candidatus Anstonellaceae archaeon]
MKIFADTSKVEEIREFASWGVIDGVTTNPKIIASDGNELEPTVKEICKIVPGPVSVEVTTNDYEEMVKEGTKYAAWAKNIVIKVPIIPAGLKAVVAFKAKGIKTNVTCAMSYNQAVLAAKAGATYVSLFYGRIGDLGYDPFIVIKDTADTFAKWNCRSEIIVGSMRSLLDVNRSMQAGAHIVTVPPKFIRQMAENPM